MTAPVDHEEMNFIGLQARIVPLVAELLATLATRNPLRMYFADIAGKTLLDIVQVLRHDGISQEAIAASLGLTLNGFQARMKRLKEQHDEPPEEDGDDRRTLMERVFAFIADHPDAEQGVPIRQVGDAFRGVKRDTLNGVLHFLVQSGFLTAEGRGGRRRLRVERRPHAQGPNEHDVGVLLYREGPLTLAELARRLECSTERAASLLDRLRRDGALVEGESDGEATFAATKRIVLASDSLTLAPLIQVEAELEAGSMAVIRTGQPLPRMNSGLIYLGGRTLTPAALAFVQEARRLKADMEQRAAVLAARFGG